MKSNKLKDLSRTLHALATLCFYVMVGAVIYAVIELSTGSQSQYVINTVSISAGLTILFSLSSILTLLKSQNTKEK